jgi:hypothetical protein
MCLFAVKGDGSEDVSFEGIERAYLRVMERLI